MSSTITTTTTANSAYDPVTLQVPGARKVSAKINYMSRTVEKPFTALYNPADGILNNHVYETPAVEITDLRGTSASDRQKAGLNVREAGFEILEGFGLAETAQGWADAKWQDPKWIETEYYNDIDRVFKDKLGVTSTFIFDHTVRKRRPRDEEDLPETPDSRKPVPMAHSDQSRWAGENRILKHLGQEILEKVKKGQLHAQLINLWRPLRGQAWDMPLAFADSRTVSKGENGQPKDWIETELRYPTWTGQTLSIYSNKAHRWYYKSGLGTDEAILLKCYDSVDETRTPHTAFEDPTTPEDAEPRWSVEVRVLAITDSWQQKQ
ncbi:related to 7alpha-cephem-methoxylase P8 chain [Melanopsichium pennsylvanicum]|uniref:Related to 7alpha-cephem-methoxylase P8 chain n=2 Tax=Melanopsichium pennsylvanicum TaxID=63383 RepID=A0AAJ4XNX3_9BASI|nr:related to 7alpha-cephem-methoxylase P8 chain [Melanopsichium pennsylvanicum 4]SNX86424.1 related to 7alpha-cephem-methoxylase P8 chain [Melanopsichium pennsylvanicum]